MAKIISMIFGIVSTLLLTVSACLPWPIYMYGINAGQDFHEPENLIALICAAIVIFLGAFCSARNRKCIYSNISILLIIIFALLIIPFATQIFTSGHSNSFPIIEIFIGAAVYLSLQQIISFSKFSLDKILLSVAIAGSALSIISLIPHAVILHNWKFGFVSNNLLINASAFTSCLIFFYLSAKKCTDCLFSMSVQIASMLLTTAVMLKTNTNQLFINTFTGSLLLLAFATMKDSSLKIQSVRYSSLFLIFFTLAISAGIPAITGNIDTVTLDHSKAIEIFKSNPFFGTGFGTYSFEAINNALSNSETFSGSYTENNIFFLAAAEGGIFAITAVIMLLYIVYTVSFNEKRSIYQGLGAISLMIPIIAALFINASGENLFYLLIILLYIIVYLDYGQNEPKYFKLKYGFVAYHISWIIPSIIIWFAATGLYSLPLINNYEKKIPDFNDLKGNVPTENIFFNPFVKPNSFFKNWGLSGAESAKNSGIIMFILESAEILESQIHYTTDCKTASALNDLQIYLSNHQKTVDKILQNEIRNYTEAAKKTTALRKFLCKDTIDPNLTNKSISNTNKTNVHNEEKTNEKKSL